ncbi:hypothetical protein HYV70_03690 [Candidatus Uhrbacteria bacterium]|nr:hypothetical protein [Candidatus Uhrbacteria bacterium]
MMYKPHFGEGIPFGPSTERAKEILREEDKRLLREIANVGGMERYLQSHPEFNKDFFTKEKRCLCCMDERTAKGTLNLPGSGIMIEGEEAQEAFRQRLQEAKIEGVYSHDGCGASKLYAKEHGIDDPNKAAVDYAKDLALKLGIEYKGHLKTSGDHPGRVVYYDTTGYLNRESPIWQEKMPTGFAISRHVLNEREGMDALLLAVKIAFSEHGEGFGRFTESDPLSLIYVLAQSEERQNITEQQLQNELHKCYQTLEEEFPQIKGKIRIEGFHASVPE